MSKTILFQTIQFSIRTQFSFIWLIERTQSDDTTLSQIGPGSDANEGVFRISQSSSITGTSPSDCSVSYHGHSLGWGLGGVLFLCWHAIDIFYSPSQLNKETIWVYCKMKIKDKFLASLSFEILRLVSKLDKRRV